MKTKFKRTISFILTFTFLIFTQTCKKLIATSTEDSVDSTAAISVDSVADVFDSVANISNAQDSSVADGNFIQHEGLKGLNDNRSSVSSNNHYETDSSKTYLPSDHDKTKSNQEIVVSYENRPIKKHIQIDNLDEIKNRIEHIERIKANTFIYAPENMSKGNNYTVMAMVNMNNIQESKRTFEERIRKSNYGSTNKNDIKCKENGVFTNKIKVSMKYDDDIFKIINSDNDTVKILDANHKELLWKWNIKPENYCSKTQLIFIFQSMDNNEVLFEEEMFVDVNISVPNGIKGYLGYLIDNPQYTFPAMIIPIVTFFAGRFFKRRKENESK